MKWNDVNCLEVFQFGSSRSRHQDGMRSATDLLEGTSVRGGGGNRAGDRRLRIAVQAWHLCMGGGLGWKNSGCSGILRKNQSKQKSLLLEELSPVNSPGEAWPRGKCQWIWKCGTWYLLVNIASLQHIFLKGDLRGVLCFPDSHSTGAWNIVSTWNILCTIVPVL